MKLKLSCLLSICLLMGSCSGGTSSRVAESGASTSNLGSTSSPSITSGSTVSYIPLPCPNGSVLNALNQTCPTGQDGANQLANDYTNNKINSINNSYK